MKFSCYDILEIQGRRYGGVEIISYKEKNKADTWQEYGLIPEDGGHTWWLTMVDKDNYCTLSQTEASIPENPNFILQEQGIQVVTGVEGDSKASVGDEADYKEYEWPVGDTRFVFFSESWHGGANNFARGQRIPLGQVRPVRDTQALLFSKQLKNKKRKKLLGQLGLGFICLLLLFGWSLDDVPSWHAFRAVIGLPYTIQEHMDDSFYYKKDSSVQGEGEYLSTLDPGATAIDLIEALDGRIDFASQDLDALDSRIIIESNTEMCRIFVVDGVTHVEVRMQDSINRKDLGSEYSIKRGDSTLQNYARMLILKNEKGRDSVLSSTETH